MWLIVADILSRVTKLFIHQITANEKCMSATLVVKCFVHIFIHIICCFLFSLLFVDVFISNDKYAYIAKWHMFCN